MTSLRTPLRLCKYCGRPVRFNLTSGRNKGRLRTCGRPKCLKAQYKDPEVCAKKGPKGTKVCELCGEVYKPTSARQRWCSICCPDQRFRALVQRYGISKPRWDALLMKQKGTCALCSNDPKVVDHDHETDTVRGLLCYSCNLLVAGLDQDPQWVRRAMTYLKKR